MKTLLLIPLLLAQAGIAQNLGVEKAKPNAKQVTPLAGGMEVAPFVCNEAHPCISRSQTIATEPTAALMEKVTDGVYTLTFIDPSNHWRCITANTQVAAFTVVCYNTSLSLVPPPVPPLAKEQPNAK